MVGGAHPTENHDSMGHDLNSRPQLPRVLGSTEALAVIVGSVIGSGIFLVPARVAQSIPAIGPIMIAWVLAGLYSLAGALTLAELGAMLPHAGGPYVYLKEAFGSLAGFLFGWTEFLVIRSGSVATLAAAFAMNLAEVYKAPGGMDPNVWKTLLAVLAMVLVAAINVAGTKKGSALQVVGTALKIGGLGAMIVGPFLLGRAHVSNLQPVWPATFGYPAFAGFMVAMVSILWTYDGWVNASELAEEIRDPGRTIPRSLTLGLFLLIGIYLAMTIAYHLVLSMPEMNAVAAQGQVVAAVFCRKLIGERGGQAIALAIMASALITLNGNAMSGPRAYFAMARDGHFPRALCRIHSRFQTPANAILAQAFWAIALTVVGSVPGLIAPPSSGGLPSWLRGMGDTAQDAALRLALYVCHLRRHRHLHVDHRQRLCPPPTPSRLAAPVPHLGLSGDARLVCGGVLCAHVQHAAQQLAGIADRARPDLARGAGLRAVLPDVPR